MAKKTAAKKPAKRADPSPQAIRRAGFKAGSVLTEDRIGRVCEAFNIATTRIQAGMCSRADLTRVDEAHGRAIEVLSGELATLADAVKRLAGLVHGVEQAPRRPVSSTGASLSDLKRYIAQEFDRLGA